MATDITIVGNLADHPELRYTPSGVAVASYTVVVNNRKQNAQTTEWENGEPDFYRCTSWRQQAENVTESFERGSRVIVTGGLTLRSYDRKDGGKGLSAEINVKEVGPALSYATAKVTKNARSDGNGGGQQAARQAPAQSEDVWGGAGANAGGSSDEEPPF